jgi:hypothetical protein
MGISASKIKPATALKRSQRDSTGRIYRQPPQACISERSSDIPRALYGIAARSYDTRVPFAPRARMRGERSFPTFREFYPFYLSEHANRTSRRLHFTGTSIAAVLIIAALLTHLWWLLAAAFIQGYAFAWVGHFFFERNKPATFKHPWLSLMGDWRLWWEILTGKLRF